MDNIRMRKNENKLIIKKGWIAQKFIILYFIIVAIVFLKYIYSSLSNNEIERIFIRFSAVSIYWMHMNKKIRRNFIFESISINFKEKKIILRTHRKKKIFYFDEIKTINIRDIKNIDAEKNPEEKYSL